MRILVINPNSNAAVTTAMARALQSLDVTGGPDIECTTVAEGPFGIETQADIERVALPIRKRVLERDDVDAYVIACYSDPGLQLCREATDKPVFGIQDCAVRTALGIADRFGVIALSGDSIERHRRYLRHMGVLEQLANERAANLTVAQSASGTGTFERLCEVGCALHVEDGAQCIILGCAGMAAHRAALEEHLGIPVIDPVQAATSMAIAAVLNTALSVD